MQHRRAEEIPREQSEIFDRVLATSPLGSKAYSTLIGPRLVSGFELIGAAYDADRPLSPDAASRLDNLGIHLRRDYF